MKTLRATFAAHVTLVDHIAAEAGSPEAMFDARVCALYTAYHHILKSGNRTQWNQVETAIARFADIKAIKEAFGVTRITTEIKHAHAVYLAYGAALTQVGVPSVMKGATAEEHDVAAADLAQQFATMVTVALTPEAKPVKTDADKAAAKQARADKADIEAQAAQQEIDEAVAAKVAAITTASALALTLADMVAIVANAVQQGMLDPEQLATLDGALDAVAANVVLIPVDSDVAAEQHA